METLEECLLEMVYITFTRSCIMYYIISFLYPEINEDNLEIDMI
jgi:hypothetical protein